jgi:hypothetical protein
MDQGQSQQRVEAGGETFPAPDQSAVLSLEPGKRLLGLFARDVLRDRASARLVGFPPALKTLGPPTPSAEALTQVFGILSCIRGQNLESVARSAPFPRADVQAIQPRDDLGPRVTSKSLSPANVPVIVPSEQM